MSNLTINRKIRRKIRILSFCLVTLFCVSFVAAQNQTPELSPTVTLISNQPIERTIAGGEKHFYQIKLAAGQFFRAEVAQPNADVEVKFYGADGEEINAVYNFGAFASAYLSFEAETAGDYRLEIAAGKTIPPNAKYTVKSRIAEKASDDDRTRMTAERLLIEISELANTSEKASLVKANEKSGQMLALWRKLGDKYWEAVTFNRIGITSVARDDLPKALESFNQALPLRRAVNDKRGEAVSLRNIGDAYKAQREWQKAVDFYEQSITIQSAIGNRRQVAALTAELAEIYNAENEMQKAITTHLKAAEIYKSLNDINNQAEEIESIALN